MAGAGAVVAITPATAAVYRCELHGKTVFTDQPCAAGASAAPLPALGTVPAGPMEKNMGRRFDRRQAAETRARDKADAEWMKAYKARREQQETVRKALVEGRVVPGMTPAEVENVLGSPLRRSGRDGAPGRWTYVDGHERRTIEFADGVVARVRSRSGKR